MSHSTYLCRNDESHRYPLYVLEKHDIDSNHALFEIEHELHMRLRIMGIKDSKAATMHTPAWSG